MDPVLIIIISIIVIILIVLIYLIYIYFGNNTNSNQPDISSDSPINNQQQNPIEIPIEPPIVVHTPSNETEQDDTPIIVAPPPQPAPISQPPPQPISQPPPQPISQPPPQPTPQPQPQPISQPEPTPISQPTPQPEGPTYTFHQGMDYIGQDIHLRNDLANNIQGLKAHCNELPNCIAFNTNGWMKHKIVPTSDWYKWTSDSSKGLYTRF
jgi:predicted component of type VI protein secretion system